MANRKSEAKRDRRAPMGVRANEAPRATRGRTSSSRTSVYVHTTGAARLDREWLHQRLGFKLGKFAARIDRADITVGNEHGARGARTLRATIQLRVAHRDPITATARGETPRAAVSAALRSCERAIRRDVERGEGKRRAPRAG